MDEGFIRPETRVLPKESLVPEESLIRPPPNRFTHVTVARTPFWYAAARLPGPEDGSLANGTKVVLLRTEENDRASVADGRGLYVVVPVSMLRPLDEGPS